MRTRSIGIFFALVSLVSVSAFADEDQRPNAFSLEIGGRAAFASINYDRLVIEQIGLGAGFGFYFTPDPVRGGIVIPVYGNYYPLTGIHRPFLSVGLDFTSHTTTESLLNFKKDSGWNSAPVLGAGYELRTESGILLRTSPYLVFSQGNVALWIGLSLGVAF